jgi:hypothetical protein
VVVACEVALEAAHRLDPALALGLSLLGGGDLSLAEHLSCVRVDGREGVGALVGVHSDHDHPYVLSSEASFEWTSGGQF